MAAMATMTLKRPSISSTLAHKPANKPTWNIHDFLSKNAQKSAPIPSSRNSNHSKHSTSSPSPKVQCQIYHEQGHSAHHCFKLLDILAGKVVGPLAFTASVEDSTPVAA